jgi:hypothetical protein
MNAFEGPCFPLEEIEAIVREVADLLDELPDVVAVETLVRQLVQCHTAVEACRRHSFSPVMRRALTSKVLDVQTEALIVRRDVRAAARSRADGRRDTARTKRGRSGRRRFDPLA